ncbi:hypothetical protein KCU98_g7097, partial [Aureobasidium melanogenum]
MDDDETRRLILRLQMEDLASIWASSTTTTDDGTELDADVSLRLYRHELRTADQQIDDMRSARTAAEDELRQRNAIRADREEARRLFQELNPDEPLPELSEADQLLLTDHSGSSNAPVKDETSSALGPIQSSEQPDMRASSSLSPHHTTTSTSGVKRSANHLDTMAEPPSKRQASELTSLPASQVKPPWGLDPERPQLRFAPSAPANPDIPARSSNPAPFPFGSLKRPAQAEGVTLPPTKRQETLPKTFTSVFIPPQSAARETDSPAVSGPSTTSHIGSVFGSFGRPSRTVTDTPRSGHGTIPGRGSAPRPRFPPRVNRRPSRTESTTSAETPVPERLPASRQPVAPGQQFTAGSDQSPTVECLVCGDEYPRIDCFVNSCSHVYCSGCINRLFKKALRDDTLWPPQCCKADMHIESVSHLLQSQLIPLVKARQDEMSTPILNRVYCIECSSFIREGMILGKEAMCPECFATTCKECKKEAHTGDCQHELEQDIEDLEKLANERGWKKCSTCLMLVEHHTGCNHMT